MRPPVYPNVRCSKPGHRDQSGYAVCARVLGGSPVGEVTLATKAAMGVVLCTGVHDESVAGACKLGGFMPVCASCAVAKGWVKA